MVYGQTDSGYAADDHHEFDEGCPEVSGKEKIQVISTGGLLSPKSLSYVGPLAKDPLDMYHVHKLFLSCKGVHIQRGISESNELQALIKRKMISIADETYLLADHSKFGMQALTQVSGWSEIQHVITDRMTIRMRWSAFVIKV